MNLPLTKLLNPQWSYTQNNCWAYHSMVWMNPPGQQGPKGSPLQFGWAASLKANPENKKEDLKLTYEGGFLIIKVLVLLRTWVIGAAIWRRQRSLLRFGAGVHYYLYYALKQFMHVIFFIIRNPLLWVAMLAEATITELLRNFAEHYRMWWQLLHIQSSRGKANRYQFTMHHA